MEIAIKYFGRNDYKLAVFPQGDWLDLTIGQDITLKAHESAIIPLNVAMALPDGFEAHLLPRSSTFRKTGLLLTNGMDIIDNSYAGDNDEWGASVYATRDITLKNGQRLFQFRLTPTQFNQVNELTFNTVEHLQGADRGGFGSTGE